MRRRRLFAVVAGGGTAGHVQPALAIARSLVALGHEPETIGYVGSRRGLESTLVPSAGFPLTTMPGRGVPRKVSFRAAVAVVEIALSCLLALAYVVSRRPRVIITVGGYAGLPVAVAGWLCRVPVIVAESNAVPGAANRLASKIARASAVAFPRSGLKGEVVTGNPVRQEIVRAGDHPESRPNARRALLLPLDRFTVLVTGGSLGARRINDAAVEMCELLSDRSDLSVRHVIGRRDWAEGLGTRIRQGGGGLVYQPVEYEDRMDLSLASADLVIARAGATTVAELCASARASILVPLPRAPGDHQSANANVLAEAGAARVLPDAECTGCRLAEIVTELKDAPGACDDMASRARSLSRPDAATAIASLAERLARK